MLNHVTKEITGFTCNKKKTLETNKNNNTSIVSFIII